MCPDGEGPDTSIKHESGDPPRTRLGRACDACSLRKTKCNQSKPCGPCSALDIPCTFDRPKRRRGPPNRLAEAIKREHGAKHTESPRAVSTESSPGISSAAPTSHHSNTLSAESVAPVELVSLLLDDYFTYLYPLMPFPHEPWFRENFSQRRDRDDPYFLALLAAMVGALVAAYPRRPRQRLKQLRREELFPTASDFVKHCQYIATEARGPGYLEKDFLNVNDAVISFCLLTLSGCAYHIAQCALYAAESQNILRSLLLRHRSGDEEYDNIEIEMTRRVYWALFIMIRSSIAFGGALQDIPLNPATSHRPHPPMPRELEDEHIYHRHIDFQHADVGSRLSGLCAHARMCLVYDAIVALDISYSSSIQEQSRVLSECLVRSKEIISTLPESLSIWTGPPSRSPSARSSSTYRDSSDISSSASLLHPERMEAAHEIQKANIGVSYLSARSYFVERYYTLLERQRESYNTVEARAWIRSERESIAADLLQCLDCIRPIHLEPNGASLCFKIRQITATLLPDSTTEDTAVDDAKLASDGKLAYYLRKFVYIVSALERGMNGPMTSPAEGHMDQAEEEDLRNWASLRRNQREYADAMAGGLRPTSAPRP